MPSGLSVGGLRGVRQGQNSKGARPTLLVSRGALAIAAYPTLS